MKTILVLPLCLAFLGAGCPENENQSQPVDPDLQVLQALDRHTSAMRKILVDNQHDCDRALELYGRYVDEHLSTLKELKSQSKKILKADLEGKYKGWKQEASARSSRDLMLFYRRCSGATYAQKLHQIHKRY